MKINIFHTASINVALYVLISFNPFLRWLFPNEIFYFGFAISSIVITVILIFKSYKRYFYLTIKKAYIIAPLLLFVVYITFPIHHYSEFRYGHILWFIPVFIFILYSSDLLQKSYEYFYGILLLISLFSLFVFVLSNLGVNLPYYTYTPQFRSNPLDQYRIYGLSVELYRGSDPISGGLISRNSGAFQEPGHFAILLCLILFFEQLDLTKFGNKVFTVAGMTTLSPYFFIVLIFLFIYKIINDENLKYKAKTILNGTLFIIFLYIIIVSNTFIGDQIKYLVYDRQFSNVDNLTELRVNQDFLQEYSRFANSNTVMFGYGHSVPQHLEINLSSNYRAFIYRFGLVGLGIWIALITMFSINVKKDKAIILLLLLITIMAHRHWYLLYPSVYTLITISIFKNDLQ